MDMVSILRQRALSYLIGDHLNQFSAATTCNYDCQLIKQNV